MEQSKFKIIKKLEEELKCKAHVIPNDIVGINLLIKRLQGKVNFKRKKMRGKILHKLGVYGMKTKTGRLDYERINDFIVSIGSNNPRKVILNFLTCSELQKVVTQVDQMVNKELSKENQ